MTPRERFWWGVLAAWGATAAVLTLSPTANTDHVAFLSVLASDQSGEDFALNMLMFAPLGWCLRRLGFSWWRVLAAALAVSAGIECAQLFIPGRASTLGDILANVLGAMCAWLSAGPVRHVVWRGAVWGAVFAAMQMLHALNTDWGLLGDVRADTYGSWESVTPADRCTASSTRIWCVTVRWNGNAVPGGLRLAEAPERTLAWVRAVDARCVEAQFTSRGSELKLRAPLVRLCDLPGAGDSVSLVLSPRVERRCASAGACTWRPVPAAEFLRPFWPENRHRPRWTEFAGAVLVIGGGVLLFGAATWLLPVGYLAGLVIAALAAGFAVPTWWNATTAIAVWVIAAGLVWLRRRAAREG